MRVKRTERGWPGHHCCAARCMFHRNTLLEYGETRLVVSTVGNLRIDGELETVGLDRYYETMVFEATFVDRDWETCI